LDEIFNDRPNIHVVAVADPDPAGRAQAKQRTRAARDYADYREMLAREKPQLVSIAPRWTGRHHAMGLAALAAGAHLYMEKPITQTLAQADELLATAGKSGLKIAVAHQMRLAPSIVRLHESLGAGLIGELLEMRAHGKQDTRAGGEDLLVLGIHLFDLMRLFGGDPLWCSARVTQNGKDITLKDARQATEDIGPIAGDEIHAQFAFRNGLNASFVSRAQYRGAAGHWGIELIGSKGRVRILADIWPNLLLLSPGEWKPAGTTFDWRPWKDDPTLAAAAAERTTAKANARVVDDWLEAIRLKRDPACSGYNAMKALEMAMAVFQAGLTGARASFPLKPRNHPLAT
jgi:predicted dehydrogenase